MKHIPPVTAVPRARLLRQNATEAEKLLWRALRETFPDARFRRQVPILHFIADFASHRVKLVIEADGGQHNDDVDAERTRLIEAQGYRVIRFWNNDIVENLEGVMTMVSAALAEGSPSSSCD